MLDRLKISWESTGSLKSDWINFLGIFIYYINGINVHHHVYYNKKYDYCYILNANKIEFRYCNINTNKIVSYSIGSIDKCVMCDATRNWKDDARR